MIIYRKLQHGESQKLWDLMNQLDNETRYMMYEPGERKEKASDAGRLEAAIEDALHDNSFLFVAADDDKLVGYISAQRERLKRIAHTAYIVAGILKQYTNQGIGTEFFQHLDAWAQAQKVTRLELTVICENEIAVHLYKKAGFEIEGTKRKSICLNGKLLDEYYMAKLTD